MAPLGVLATCLALALPTVVAARVRALQYVALGDSTGVGVGARGDGGYVARLHRRIEQERGPVALVNLCVSGARADDLLNYQLEPALAAHPALVTIGIGINDVTRGTPPERFRAVYERIADRLTRGGAQVVVVNIPDLSLSPLATGPARLALRGRIRTFNAIIGAIAARHGFHLVDLFQASEALLPHHPELFSEDLFHPSAKGYDRWAEAMWPVFEEAAGQIQ